MNSMHQFLPKGYPKTPIYAFAGKDSNGNFVPSYPGPSIIAFKGTPIEITWTNMITGRHFLPVDISPPFDMLADYTN